MTHQFQEKLWLRLPDGMRDMIREKAKAAHRSMNAEIVYQLSRAYGQTENEKAGEPLTA